MGIRFDLEQIVNQVGRDKGVNKQVLIDALESAVLSAAKKHFGHNLNLEATYNLELSEIEVHEFRTVVDSVSDTQTEITWEDAKKEFDPDCEIGDELGRKLDSDVLGRIAAQTAKQVIVQKLRDAERDIIYHEYKDRKGEIVNGIVQRFERGNLIERVDIVTWTPDAPSFVARALSPADVVRVVVDEDEHGMEVVVSDDQLSLAIGRGGQNVKLASKLSGWRIDV
ncbi:UNVERIFIED_CONTAM: hypothetical protein GTU68_032584, partial [Idotea baltica]|nr:hypothetical protein [Idotea baltica]